MSQDMPTRDFGKVDSRIPVHRATARGDFGYHSSNILATVDPDSTFSRTTSNANGSPHEDFLLKYCNDHVLEHGNLSYGVARPAGREFPFPTLNSLMHANNIRCTYRVP